MHFLELVAEYLFCENIYSVPYRDLVTPVTLSPQQMSTGQHLVGSCSSTVALRAWRRQSLSMKAREGVPDSIMRAGEGIRSEQLRYAEVIFQVELNMCFGYYQ